MKTYNFRIKSEMCQLSITTPILYICQQYIGDEYHLSFICNNFEISEFNLMSILQCDWLSHLEKNWLYLITWVGIVTSPTDSFANDKFK